MSAHRAESPRVAVIGGGHLGRIHAKLLASNNNCQFVAVADPSTSARDLVKSSLGLEAVEDFKSLAGRIDGVVIAAPTFLHHSIGTWALEQKLHVFMEKPIAANVEQAEELVGLAKANHCTLQVGHVERFNPAWREVCRTTDRNSVRYIEASREGTYTGRSTDIGIVMDLMIHDLDLILSLVQSPVENVQAFGWQVLGNHEDFAVAQLRFRNGTIAQLRASRVSETPVRAMSIYCDEGIKQINFATGSICTTEPVEEVASGARLADALPHEARSQVKDRLFEDWLKKTTVQPTSTNAIVEEHNEFLSAMRIGSDVTVSGSSGRDALAIACEIVSAIRQSSPQRSVIPAKDRFAA